MNLIRIFICPSKVSKEISYAPEQNVLLTIDIHDDVM